MKSLEKIDILHVPYKGANLATVALIGGEVDQVIGPLASALVQIRAGKVRALAVLSEQRVGAAPDIPTAKESGVDNFVISTWYGLFAPAGTPRDIVARLHRETARALDDPGLRDRFAAAGIEGWIGTPEQLGALVKSEMARYATIIRQAGLKAD